MLSPQTFGAIGDGTSHPVSQWLKGGAHDRGYADLSALKVDYPHVVGLTDEIDWAALRKAVVSARGAQTVELPAGKYMVNRQLVTGHQVPLVGEGRAATFLCPTPVFLIDQGPDQAVVRLSRGDLPFEHANSLRDLCVSCVGNADVGVDTTNVNEQGGLERVECKGWRKKGFWIHGPACQNFSISNCAFGTAFASVDNAVCIHLQQANHPLSIDRVSCSIRRPDEKRAADGVGILCEAGASTNPLITNSHFEMVVDGIRCTYGRAFAINCDGHGQVDNVIHWMSKGRGWAEMLVAAKGGYCVKDSTGPGAAIRYGTNVMNGRWAAARAPGAGLVVEG